MGQQKPKEEKIVEGRQPGAKAEQEKEGASGHLPTKSAFQPSPPSGQKEEPPQAKEARPEQKTEVQRPGEQQSGKQVQQREAASKKWKGKDWFAILAPKMFNEVRLAETPTMDSANLIGRNLEIGASELLGQPQKYYMKLFFKVTDADSRNAYTRFNGYATSREYIYRVVRKRNQKVESTDYFDTRDGWKLQITSMAILNRNTDSEIQKKVRIIMVNHIAEAAKKSGVDDLVKKVLEGSLQKEIRKLGTKIYPVRFCEIAKIEVVKAPQGK